MNRQYPRLVLRDSSFRSNARETISRCAACGIQVCGVIKGVNGLPEVARRFRECGVTQLGTSRLEQVERCRQAGIPGPYRIWAICGRATGTTRKWCRPACMWSAGCPMSTCPA